MAWCIVRYTLWNAEYRISLMRNFDLSPDTSKSLNFSEEDGVSTKHDESEGGCSEVGVDCGAEDVERTNLQSLGDLSPEVLNYIQQMESELSTVKQVSFYLLNSYISNLKWNCILLI